MINLFENSYNFLSYSKLKFIADRYRTAQTGRPSRDQNRRRDDSTIIYVPDSHHSRSPHSRSPSPAHAISPSGSRNFSRTDTDVAAAAAAWDSNCFQLCGGSPASCSPNTAVFDGCYQQAAGSINSCMFVLTSLQTILVNFFKLISKKELLSLCTVFISHFGCDGDIKANKYLQNKFLRGEFFHVFFYFRRIRCQKLKYTSNIFGDSKKTKTLEIIAHIYVY